MAKKAAATNNCRQKKSAVEVSDSDRIQIFCEAVESDRLILREIGYPEQVHMSGDHPDEYAKLLVTAMLFRKYFEPGENVKLTKVLISVRKCLPQKKDTDMRHSLKVFSECIPNWGKPEIHLSEFAVDNDTLQSSNELLLDILYGKALHGDYDRAKRINRIPLSFRCMALSETNGLRSEGINFFTVKYKNGKQQANSKSNHHGSSEIHTEPIKFENKCEQGTRHCPASAGPFLSVVPILLETRKRPVSYPRDLRQDRKRDPRSINCC